MSWRIASTVLFIGVLGCEQPLPTHAKTEKRADPVEGLKRLVNIGEVTDRENGWVTTGVQYDVQKTASLVSPFAGLVSFRARATIKGTEYDDDLKLTFAFQDGRWVYKSGQDRGNSYGGTPWFDVNDRNL